MDLEQFHSIDTKFFVPSNKGINIIKNKGSKIFVNLDMVGGLSAFLEFLITYSKWITKPEISTHIGFHSFILSGKYVRGDHG